MITTELLFDIVNQAVKHGATEAEAVGAESTEFHVEVRLGEVEKLHEAASRGIGLRVLYQGRQASISTSDVSPQAIGEMISSAVEMAKLTSVDDAVALPYGDELARKIADLRLYDPGVCELTTERKIEMARTAEAAARGADPRITN
ncbi:MAG: TldD/PmbA family protein, partial [Blastocatellia bacterium]|nr:TldD/PmbA family protein [Blastocatellia bacterium]